MLNKRERNIGIVTGIVIGALVLDSIFLSPLLARRRDANARIDAATQDLVRAEQIAQNDERASRRWGELAGDTLQSDASTAESQVLNAAPRWARQAGLSLTLLEPQRREQEQGFQKITFRATADGDLERLARFLHAAQTSDIPMRITDMQINVRRSGSDELSMQVGLATIYLPPDASRPDQRERIR